jgi:hypothetical protein
MALKNFKRAFNSDNAYLVLTVEGADAEYGKVTVMNGSKSVSVEKNKKTADETKDLRKRLKASDTDLIYDLSEISGCNDRKKGFIFKDPGAADAEVHVNASNTIIYGNAEVLGVDIKALYMSADKRLIGKGKVDSSRIKNESIQSALEFVNIDGLKGELGCDVNGSEQYNLYYLDLQNRVVEEDVSTAKKALEKAAAGEEKKKAAKKYFSMAKAYLRSVEEGNLTAELEGARKSMADAKKQVDDNEVQAEDSFLESLGIRFKRASMIHYEAQDVDKDLNGLLNKLRTKIDANSQLLVAEGQDAAQEEE